MDLTQILEATVSPDTQLLLQAQQQLEQAANANLPQFLLALANELANVSKSQVARLAAGLQLKNFLTSKNSDMKLRYQQLWLSVDPQIRTTIKTQVLSTLGTEPSNQRSAAQCVAYIAAAELPVNQWPEVINILLTNVTGPSSTEAVREASLEAIGYICEELKPSILAVKSNEILTAIVQGMRKEEPSVKVRLAATKALLNSLEFTKANFEKEMERNYLMQVVCEASQCPDVHVQVAALQNLVKIMSLYYQYMEPYMGPALFAITIQAMKSDVNEVSLQGIEFWSTVCDEESDLAIEAIEAAEVGRPPDQTSKFYVKGALQYLVPILLLNLTKQEEYDDEDDWNPCKAAGVCLSLISACCENDIVPHVLPFVDQHLQNTDWKFRDAAIMALGCITEGPEASTMQRFVKMKMTILISLMNDPMVQVQDTAAWTLGRICDQLPEVALDSSCCPALLECLGAGLEREPRVAANVCWAFSSLAESAYDLASPDEETDPDSYALSFAFEAIVTKIMTTADRDDSSQSNLRTSAYEALMDLIKYSAKDCYIVIQKTTQEMMNRLQTVITALQQGSISGADKQKVADIESLICATLQSLLRKVSPEDAASISDSVMKSLLLMFETNATATDSSSDIMEDAMATIGVLVEALGVKFLVYMDVFYPYLKSSLQNRAAYQVCQSTVGIVGELCRALTDKFTPYCNDIMEIMITILSDATVHRSIKPQILSTIGDIALATGKDFKPFLDVVFRVLKEATQLQVVINKDDYELVDYVNELREGCLEAYTGIVQGLKGEDGVQSVHLSAMQPEIPFMFEFMEHLANDQDRPDTITSCCGGLMGDLCSAYGKALLPEIQKRTAISRLLQEGKTSRNKHTRSLCGWALKEIKTMQKW